MNTNDGIRTELTPSQHQVVLGTLFGDGSLTMGKHSRNARLHFRVSEKDREYIFWKYRGLETTGVFKSPPKFRLCKSGYKFKRTGDLQRVWYLFSRSLPIMTQYRELFYPNGEKSISQSALENLNALGLAVWYMDDGHFHDSLKYKYCRVGLSTQGFTCEDNELVRSWLAGRFGLHFHLHRVKEGHGSELYLTIGKEVRRFLDIVRPYVSQVGCMERKLQREAVKSGQL